MHHIRKVINVNQVVSRFNVLKLSTCGSLKIHTGTQKFTDAVNSQNNNVLVYEAPLKKRVKIVKLLSLSSSMLGFAVFPKAIIDLSHVNIYVACATGAFSALFLSTPLMLHWVTKRYVLDLHFDHDTRTFTAKTYNIVCQLQETKFQASDVTVPDLPGMLSSFSVNGKPLFVDANIIQDPDAYSHMMGYDKPFDIVLKPEEQHENKT